MVSPGRSLDRDGANQQVCHDWTTAIENLRRRPGSSVDYEKMKRDAAAADRQRAKEANSDELARRRKEREQKKAELREKYGLEPQA